MRFLLLCPAALLLLACLTARANGASPTGKGDSLPGDSSKSGRLVDRITDDSLLGEITKDKPSSPLHFPPSSSREVRELRIKLALERNKSKSLLRAMKTAEANVINLEREKINLASQLRSANRNTAKLNVKVINVRQGLEKCLKSGGNLSPSEIENLVDTETRRRVQELLKPNSNFSLPTTKAPCYPRIYNPFQKDKQ